MLLCGKEWTLVRHTARIELCIVLSMLGLYKDNQPIDFITASAGKFIQHGYWGRTEVRRF